MRLLGLLAEDRVNIIDVTHHREGVDIFVTETEVELTVEVRDADHRREVLDLLAARGYDVERVR